MHKILLALLLFVTLVFPNSEVFAQTRPGGQAPNPADPAPPGTGATRPGGQTDPTNTNPPGVGVTRPGVKVCECPPGLTPDTTKNKCVSPTGVVSELRCYRA